MAESTDAAPEVPEDDQLPSAERLKAFTDAVVAIAMTLLILPLMDSVAEAGSASETVETWLGEEAVSLATFALSFVLIANFWIAHHRMFTRVVHVDRALMWLTVAWMFTIVWLPVATAITSAFAEDPLQKVLYIGTLILTSALLALTRWYLYRHPSLHRESPALMREGLTVAIVISAMFVVALILSLTIPVLNYWALFVMFLARPVISLFRRKTKVTG